ncbi:hypothetical protein PIB30_084880 [Stylosanthes scabra]|uniref:Uncharacterized protein n=1 Tax=Stylosanthes scabra TaxID=79078 RepID=A0ABU6XSB2_9FABA|nr:hypothetical protein [Stylosanthes scabra]
MGFINLPPPGENDMFITRVVARKNGELDMDLVYQVIGRSGTNCANNPADNTIPDRKIDNAILNAQATAWHKLIIANIDPKQHGTTFDLNHAILIYVLMTEGVVNLPCIMRDVLLKWPMGNSRNLLPYSVLIARLAIRYQVPKFPRIEIYNELLQLNTQSMLRDAFPDMTFRNLLPVTSSEDNSDPES